MYRTSRSRNKKQADTVNVVNYRGGEYMKEAFVKLWETHPWAATAVLIAGVAGASAVLFKLFS